MSLLGGTFFVRERGFYRAFFGMTAAVALQNIVAYSVNMLDNVMLGSYSQEALSGAATVNQVFFVVEQLTLALASALVVLAAQYWGERRREPIASLTGVALKLAFLIGGVLTALSALFPREILSLFTPSEVIIAEGATYLAYVEWTFVPFMATSVLMAALRSVETVKIAFYISAASLVLKFFLNYALIFGHLGSPELGIAGAGAGTLLTRLFELSLVLLYLKKFDARLRLGLKETLAPARTLARDYLKIGWPILVSQLLWAVSIPAQTAILGHLSDDAIAANSVATTFYQYLKVIVAALASASAVSMGLAIGSGDEARARREARTLSVIYALTGLVLGAALLALSGPLLSLYSLSPSAETLTEDLMLVMAVVMVFMSYQMPVSTGIIQGSGDPKFVMRMNLVSIWGIVLPLSFAAAFWWELSVPLVVLCLQSDQIFKCVPVLWYFKSYKWIRRLTRK